MSNPNISPVDWYLVSYLLRFIEIEDDRNFDDERKFLVWENTILVKAKNLDEAFSKGEKLAQEATEPYKGGPEGIPVQWLYEGITDVLPIYDPLEDGTEIMFSEYKRKLKNIRKKAKTKNEIYRTAE